MFTILITTLKFNVYTLSLYCVLFNSWLLNFTILLQWEYSCNVLVYERENTILMKQHEAEQKKIELKFFNGKLLVAS